MGGLVEWDGSHFHFDADLVYIEVHVLILCALLLVFLAMCQFCRQDAADELEKEMLEAEKEIEALGKRNKELKGEIERVRDALRRR